MVSIVEFWRAFGGVSSAEEHLAEAFFEDLWDLPRETRDQAEASPLSIRDASAAVTPFSATERARMEPLLGTQQLADAVTWNVAKHPSKSGLTGAEIQAAFADYVDLAAVRAAIDRHNQDDPSNALPMGNPPFDTPLVEAIHQFQRKCFFDRQQHDGKAGVGVLDSLGFIDRSGLHATRRVNRTARARLRKIPVSRLTEGKMTAETWFRFLLNPSFLGWNFVSGGTSRTGAHLLLVRKLRVAERWLLTRKNLVGATPVGLGKALLFGRTSEVHRGARMGSNSTSIHTFGLAMDIKYTGNPWVTGADFTRAMKRAARLVSGTKITHSTINRYLHSLGSAPHQTTEKIYDILAGHDADFIRYMLVPERPDTLQQFLEDRKEDGTSGVFNRGESIEAAARRWKTRAGKDLHAMRTKRSSPFHKSGGGFRDPQQGILDLDKDLVVALRDHACLAWGAVDLGPTARGAGDIMHFDARVCGLGDRLVTPTSQRRVIKGHPCLPCRPPLLERERGTATPSGSERRLRRLTRSRTPPSLGPAPPRETIYVDILLGSEGSAKPMTGIFVPQHYRLPSTHEVDIILYLHGHKRGMAGFGNSMSIDSYWNSTRFNGLWALREGLNATGRNAILVAPTLGSRSGAGSLVKRGGLDWYLEQVLLALQVYRPMGRATPPLLLRNLILASHSGGGAHMRTLARSRARLAGHIRECWGFDSLYGGVDEWEEWAKEHPNATYYEYTFDTTPARNGARLQRRGLPNVKVESSRVKNHFKVPLEYWKERIVGAPSLSSHRFETF